MNQNTSTFKNNFLISTFHVVSLFPFVSPFPIGSDLQPISGIFAILILIKHHNLKHRISLSQFLAYLFIFFSSFHLIANVLTDNINFFKHLSFIYGAVVFISFSKFNFYNIKFLKIGIYIYFTSFLLYFVSPFVYNFIYQNFVSQREVIGASFSINDYRGISLLSNEPSYFASILAFLLVLNDRLYRESKQSNFYFIFHFLLIFILLLFNKSGSGLFYLLIYFTYFFSKLDKSKMFLGGFVLIVIFFTYIINISLQDIRSFNRSADLIFKIISGEIGSDVAFTRRLTDFIIGFNSVFDNPIGYGTGGIDDVIKKYSSSFLTLDSNREGLVSSLSNGLISFGLFFGFLILVLFYKSKSNWIEKFFAFLMLSFSLSFGFPLTWALLTFKNNNYENLCYWRSRNDRFSSS